VYALGVSLYNAASAELLQDLLVAQARALLAIRRARTFLRGYCREHQVHSPTPPAGACLPAAQSQGSFTCCMRVPCAPDDCQGA
jgi:hypothetical protein